MSLVRNNSTDGHIIKGFKQGLLCVDDIQIKSNVIISPQTLITNWTSKDISDLCIEDFAEISTLKLDILLIGSGCNLIFIKPDLYSALAATGIGVEVMQTQVACYTYNALSSEHRKVAAALFIK